MADVNDDKAVTLKLTDEQKRSLADAFGDEFASQAKNVSVQRADGAIRVSVHNN
ncbi:hypothetical protein SAMN04487846_0007 [Microbacterium sp. cf046]|uniref:hypothetical protein n=1 Tax=Microbacterium sp. cf046 TaxID=1761803 RepID=UPI0008E737A8|nr:hypothetical protein [Microbacterium sp. cf046]SFR85661.1 hypothetical protein SAMN04487846_0007 [Microbacterium sp. cf046]